MYVGTLEFIFPVCSSKSVLKLQGKLHMEWRIKNQQKHTRKSRRKSKNSLAQIIRSMTIELRQKKK
jgi:hypothetical protein